MNDPTLAPAHPKTGHTSVGASDPQALKPCPKICPTCGIQFAIPYFYHLALLNTHGNIVCPNGHGITYSAQTRAERLADRVADLTETVNALSLTNEELRRKNAYLKGQVTKTINKLTKLQEAPDGA